MKKLIILLLFCGVVRADITGMAINLASWHPNNNEMNETNPGIGIEFDCLLGQCVAGYFKNSFDRDSFYTGININEKVSPCGYIGVQPVIITGYNLPVLISPYYQYKFMRIFIALDVSNSDNAAVGLQYYKGF